MIQATPNPPSSPFGGTTIDACFDIDSDVTSKDQASTTITANREFPDESDQACTSITANHEFPDEGDQVSVLPRIVDSWTKASAK